MTQDIPLISCVLIYKGNDYNGLLKAIEGFESQDYDYKELIIVNNRPTQHEASTLNIAAKANVILIDTPIFLPAGTARNFGLSHANGQIIAQFRLDYHYEPHYLSTLAKAMAAEPASMVMLGKTLQYSHITGNATYQVRGVAVYDTCMFIRPNGIDYDNIDKNEELSLIQKFSHNNMAVSIVNCPKLVIKAIKGPKNTILKSSVDEEEEAIIAKYLMH
jgi:glycosyltransferase involved in cell wall biosynthesis